MNTDQIDIDIDGACGNNLAAAASRTSLVSQGLRLLSPQEVGAVAGGPEATLATA